MKKSLIISLFLCTVLSIKAQEHNNDFFLAKDTVIGKTISGTKLTAKHYQAPNKIYRWHWDGVTDNLLLELRETNKKETSFKNEGYLAMIDLNNKSVRWKKPVNYNNSETKIQGKYLLSSKKKKNYLLNPETGEAIWENKNDFYFIEPTLNIGIGYPVQTLSNKLSAVDMQSGNTLWSASIDRIQGWDDAYMLTDSVLLIANSDGINALDLTRGRRWQYKASTEQAKVGKMIVVNFLGILTEVLFGVGVYQTSPDEVSELNSNMLIDTDNNVVYASRDRISKISSSGDIVWSTPLPKKQTSKSSIFLLDSVVYMINRGHAVYNGDFATVGTPYFAAFNIIDGNQLFMNVIAENKEFVRTFQVVNNLLFLVFENKIATYSLADGNLQTEKIIGLNSNEHLDAFIESDVFIRKNDSTFLDLTQAYPYQNFMLTSANRVLSITDKLETLISYEKNDVFEKTIDTDNYIILTNNKKDFILCDSFNNTIATFQALPNMFIANNKLYGFDDYSFWEMDLRQFR